MLARLFEPRSVAVVGASGTPGKAGNALMHSLESFPGAVYAVNPRGEPVAGRAGYASVSEIPDPVDLVLLAIPPAATLPVVRECVDAGVGAVVVHSGGWVEAGEDGRSLQADLDALASGSPLRILGPNTSGFFNPPARLCASFVRHAATLPPGGLAIVAQSGGVNHALAFLAEGEGIGVRLGVGLGNAVDVSWTDVLDHLAADPSVEVVALAIEGVADGRGLVEAVERLSERVPVVALKTGRTDVEAFAFSHTGALTGSWRVARAALAHAGAVVVDDLTQLVDAAQALRLIRLPASARTGVGVVTGQAGPGLLLADELAATGVLLPELPAPTRARLGELLPPITYQSNPVDTGRPADTFGAVLDTVAAAPEIELLAVYLLDEPDAVDPASLFAGAGPAVLALTARRDRLDEVRVQLDEIRVPVLPTPERAARAVAAVVRDARQRSSRISGRPAAVQATTVPTAGNWDESSAKALIEELGLATPRRIACTTHEEAHAALGELTTPVVVKLLHPAVAHKSDVGGVHLGVATAESLDLALAAIDRTEGARYLLEETAADGHELLLGGRRDAAFGPIVVLGAGGVDAEAADDVSVRLAPVSRVAAGGMLDELAGAARYRGVRGAAAVDEPELAAAIEALGDLLRSRPDILEIEVNPLRVTAGGLVALDALVVGA